jgi:hypothetical protein
VALGTDIFSGKEPPRSMKSKILSLRHPSPKSMQNKAHKTANLHFFIPRRIARRSGMLSSGCAPEA